jgi:hypothetical protein
MSQRMAGMWILSFTVVERLELVRCKILSKELLEAGYEKRAIKLGHLNQIFPYMQNVAATDERRCL